MRHSKQREKSPEWQDRRAEHHQSRERKEKVVEKDSKQQLLQFRYGISLDDDEDID